jgi:mRNA-degrading endonuclease RelE of RelBE toxin-antitoxin system
MRFGFKSSFDRSVESLALKTKQEIKDLSITHIDILSGTRDLPAGLGLKNVRKNFWEIRKGLKLRILFRWTDDHVEYILAGTHEKIKRFLTGKI